MIEPDNTRPAPDHEMVEIAEYVTQFEITSEEAYNTARLCLMDAIGCAIASLAYPACRKLLGPIVPGTIVPDGSRIPGTQFQLDPVQAAFNFGSMIRWLDYNDTWLAAEWGHPSDNLGGILMTADWLSRSARSEGRSPLTVRDVLTALIKAYEIQGVLALKNSFNRIGLDHVILVKVASTAVLAQMLGCSREQIINAVSNAWLDGHSLRTYRHAPNTGTRKSWAAGDATSRAVQLAWLARKGEMGYPSVLSAKTWGFYDVFFKGSPLLISRPYSTYVVENILFKVAFPAEFHAQTAVEAAIKLHPVVKDRLTEVEKVVIYTQESAMRIINKKGPLHNPADRDHCIQFMTVVGLIFGELTADYYEDDIASDPRIDILRSKTICEENNTYTRNYLDPEKRSIGNAVQVWFKDGSCTELIEVEYPLGHKRRRNEALTLIYDKFRKNLAGLFPKEKIDLIEDQFRTPSRIDNLPVYELTNTLCN